MKSFISKLYTASISLIILSTSFAIANDDLNVQEQFVSNNTQVYDEQVYDEQTYDEQALFSGGPWYNFIAQHSGKCLDVYGGHSNDRNNILHWNCNGSAAQEFRLVPWPGTNGYSIRTLHNKCVSIEDGSSSNGANVNQFHCNGTGAQLFYLIPVGNGNYYLRNHTSQKCVDASGGHAGANVHQWGCHWRDNQKWDLSFKRF